MHLRFVRPAPYPVAAALLGVALLGFAPPGICREANAPHRRPRPTSGMVEP